MPYFSQHARIGHDAGDLRKRVELLDQPSDRLLGLDEGHPLHQSRMQTSHQPVEPDAGKVTVAAGDRHPHAARAHVPDKLPVESLEAGHGNSEGIFQEARGQDDDRRLARCPGGPEHGDIADGHADLAEIGEMRAGLFEGKRTDRQPVVEFAHQSGLAGHRQIAQLDLARRSHIRVEPAKQGGVAPCLFHETPQVAELLGFNSLPSTPGCPEPAGEVSQCSKKAETHCFWRCPRGAL